jgi:DUF2934 family protein
MADNRGALRNPSVQVEANLDEEIQRRAYEIYIQRGQEDGYALDDWLRAEREIRAHGNQRQPSAYSSPSSPNRAA